MSRSVRMDNGSYASEDEPIIHMAGLAIAEDFDYPNPSEPRRHSPNGRGAGTRPQETKYPSLPPITSFQRQIGRPIKFTPGCREFPAPRDQDPLTLFKPMINACTIPELRYIRIDRDGKPSVLLFTDGAALDNGRETVRAGCGVVIVPFSDGLSFPLERVNDEPLTSNRGELRAAVEALRLRVWTGEGFKKIVIGTDSEYMVKGVNEWYLKWQRNGWKTNNGKRVKNKDLWEMLIIEIEKWEKFGVPVQFYLMKRRFNKADVAAKKAALLKDVPTTFCQAIYLPDVNAHAHLDQYEF
ncbi:ribonuclease H-like domain-containing protein [Crucibulum laeve]|uniref:ribonuclease H n=1 Tax=Crucibulum laeve TaxID=68775 RepID=A0A5C3M0Z1_9AGAR|nr:ribonuclease H-like domain-containing protein [Crucibulum laeve]